MKVALVHDFLVRLGGAERVLKVLADMYPLAPIYTLIYNEKAVKDVFPSERVRTSSLQKWSRFINYRALFPWMPRAVEEWDFSQYDLVISSSSAYVHGVLTPLKTRHICYCHTPMRYIWDYSHEYLDEQHIHGLTRFYLENKLSQIRMWDQVASSRPDAYICNSHTVKMRVQKYYRRDSTVIYPPVDIDKFKAQKSHEDYFLIVSTLTPYKKIDLAVQLFNKIRRRLVVIGGGKQLPYLRRIAGPTIDILGQKSDEIVREYIQNCRGFIFPSEEDFGIAPIEAMAAGKPVLAYRKGGLTETVIEGETGEFFNQQNLLSMEHGLARLMLNEKHYQPKKIREHAKRFSIENFKKNFRSFVRSFTNLKCTPVKKRDVE